MELGREDLLASYGADAILLPLETALTSGAAEDSGWCDANRDEVAVLRLGDCP